MRVSRCTDETSVRTTCTVGYQIDAHFSFWRFDGSVRGTWWDLESLGKQLEMVN